MGCPLKAHAEHFIHTASCKLALRDRIQIFKNGLWLHTKRSSTTISQFQWPWKNKVWSFIMLCGLLIYKQAFTPAELKMEQFSFLELAFGERKKTPQRRWGLSWLSRARSYIQATKHYIVVRTKACSPPPWWFSQTAHNCISSGCNGPLDSSIPWCYREQ